MPVAKFATMPAAGYYEGNDLLTPAEVAAWLKVKPSWVAEQTKQRTKNPLPHTRLGKYCRFSRMRIAEWLAENST